jgi:glycosyltransferase involved in cell wall biosynthesis
MSLDIVMAVRFSIVVPTLDRRDMLLRALASIRAQTWPDVEIIVIDGGSTDGTLEALSKHPDVTCRSGRDQGVYDAFNKGIAQASGDVIGLLNSDDVYEPNTFHAVAEAFLAQPDADAVCGTALLEEELEEETRIIDVFDRETDKVLSARTVLIGSCVPNARFFRRSAMARIGTFDLLYRYVADRDWLARWLKAGLRTVAIPQNVYRYKQHTGSLTFDPGRRRETAIRTELLALGQRWRTDKTVSADLRWVAAGLEGRCRARLAGGAMRQGRMTDATKWLLFDKERISLMPLVAIMCGGIDWAIQTLSFAGSRQRGTAEDRPKPSPHRADSAL